MGSCIALRRDGSLKILPSGSFTRSSTGIRSPTSSTNRSVAPGRAWRRRADGEKFRAGRWRRYRERRAIHLRGSGEVCVRPELSAAFSPLRKGSFSRSRPPPFCALAPGPDSAPAERLDLNHLNAPLPQLHGARPWPPLAGNGSPPAAERSGRHCSAAR